MKNLKLALLAAMISTTAVSQAFLIVGGNLNGNALNNYGEFGNVGLDVDKGFFTTNPIDLILEVTAADAGNIRELSELVFNESGVEWTDFHMELIPLTGVLPTFVQSVAGNPWDDSSGNPLPNVTIVNPLTIDVFWTLGDGQVAATGYFTNTQGRLAIDCRNMKQGDQFLLREYPTFVPEPGTFVAMGAGALALIVRRRKK